MGVKVRMRIGSLSWSDGWREGPGRGWSLTSSACSVVDGTNARRSYERATRTERKERSRGRKEEDREQEGKRQVEIQVYRASQLMVI